jgi:SAM-dependent methyltransferase
MSDVPSVPHSDQLLAEQVAYYRARAPIYDDWWEGTGSYLREPGIAAAWESERRAFERQVTDWLEQERPAHVLEIAGGTGNLTRLIAPHVDAMTVIDSSPEVLEINRAKLGPLADRITYDVTDVFTWAPPATYDAAAMGFWVSHVPTDRWSAFWQMVRAAVSPTGSVWIGDNAEPERGWEAGYVPRPADPERLTTDGTIDMRTHVHERSLPNGRTYDIVKRFHSPTALVADLAAVGFDAEAATTEWAFITAVARPTSGPAPR